jgi:hypothetical protein
MMAPFPFPQLCPIGLCQKFQLLQSPRGKWHCPACSLKSPRKSSKKARTMKNTEDEPEEEAEGAGGEETDASHMEVDEEKVVVAPVATPASKKKAARAAIKVKGEL